MEQLALLLLAAAAALAVSRWTGIPAAPLMILAGALLPFTGLLAAPDVEQILVLSLTVLVFVAGTALEPSPAGSQRAAAVRVGAVQFGALGGLGLGLALALGYGTTAALHIAVALAASSTLLGIRILQRRRQLFEPFGRLVAGVLLLQDLLVVILIPVLTHLEDEPAALLAPLGWSLALVAVAWLLHRHLGPLLLERVDLDSETWLLVFLAVLFLFLGAADAGGVPAVTAAFLAGFSLARFPVSTVARGQLASLNDFFAALFFTALGTYVVVPTLRELVHGMVLAATVVLVTPVVVALVAERRGFTARAGILSGLILAQTSEFSLVVVLQGAAAGVLSPGVFTVVSLVTVLTMSATPLLATDGLAWKLLHLHPFRAKPERTPAPSDHVLLLGCGSNGMQVLDVLVLEGAPVLVVDEDPRVVGSLQEAGIPAIRGDAAEPRVLEAAGISRARVVVSTLRRPRDNEVVLERGGRVPVLVRVFEAEDEAWTRARGGLPISFADATAEDFVRWYRDEAAERTGPRDA